MNDFSESHLDGLSIVDFDNVKAEAVNAAPRSLEHAGLQVEMVADVD